MDTTVRTTTYDGVPVVHVGGELDLHGVDDVRRELVALVHEEHPEVVVDLTRVTFIDSTGLGVLVGARKEIHQRGGRLTLVIDGEGLLKTLRISSLTRLFTICDSLEKATAGAGSGV